jgi:hypothetical protein
MRKQRGSDGNHKLGKRRCGFRAREITKIVEAYWRLGSVRWTLLKPNGRCGSSLASLRREPRCGAATEAYRSALPSLWPVSLYGSSAVRSYRQCKGKPQAQHRSEYRSLAVMRNAHMASFWPHHICSEPRHLCRFIRLRDIAIPICQRRREDASAGRSKIASGWDAKGLHRRAFAGRQTG